MNVRLERFIICSKMQALQVLSQQYSISDKQDIRKSQSNVLQFNLKTFKFG